MREEFPENFGREQASKLIDSSYEDILEFQSYESEVENGITEENISYAIVAAEKTRSLRSDIDQDMQILDAMIQDLQIDPTILDLDEVVTLVDFMNITRINDGKLRVPGKTKENASDYQREIIEATKRNYNKLQRFVNLYEEVC